MYYYEGDASDEAVQINIPGISNSSYTFADLTAGSTYTFYLVSLAEPNLTSEDSNTSTCVVYETPNNVRQDIVSSGSEQAAVTWKNGIQIEGQTGLRYDVLLYQDLEVVDVLVDASYGIPFVDSSANVYGPVSFTGLTNGAFYYFKIIFYASSEIEACPEVFSVTTTSDVVPSGTPLIYDVDSSDCSISFKVNSNTSYNAGFLGTKQRAVLHNAHTSGSVEIQNVFEVIWSSPNMPTVIGDSEVDSVTVPITEIWGLDFTVSYTISRTLIENPETIIDNGVINTVLPDSKTYLITIVPDSEQDCIIGGYLFASNNTGMSSSYVCSATDIFPCPVAP
jgi:hypothetical protein